MKKLVFFATFILLGALYIVAAPLWAQPGDVNDPLVTRRYVDARISELMTEIAILRTQIGLPVVHQPPAGGTGVGFTQADRDALFADVILHFELVYGEMLRTAAINTAGVVPFEVIHVAAHSTLVFEAGVEFILRSGQATVIAGPNGLTDITQGRDIRNGEAISQNHLLLVPVSDGRGAYFSTSAWIMIKGRFHVI